MGIHVKFGTAHGRSRPEVGSGFPIEAYMGAEGFPGDQEILAKNNWQ